MKKNTGIQFRKEFASILLKIKILSAPISNHYVTTKMGRNDGGKRKGGNQNLIEGES